MSLALRVCSGVGCAKTLNGDEEGQANLCVIDGLGAVKSERKGLDRGTIGQRTYHVLVKLGTEAEPAILIKGGRTNVIVFFSVIKYT
jgi:hypothetical protein